MQVVLSGKERAGVFFLCSILLHIGLFALILLAPRSFTPVQKKGEPIFVELPELDNRPAPAGRPSPPPKSLPTPQVKAPTADVPSSKSMVARSAPAPRATPPAPRLSEPKAPTEAESIKPPSPPADTPAAEPSSLIGSGREYALVPKLDVPPKLPGEVTDRGGGLGGPGGEGSGSPDGEPVPLDTPNPRYSAYFAILREKIREKWVPPYDNEYRPKHSFVYMTIAKDGRLYRVELRRTSGASAFDQSTVTAIKLAAPFPPIPDSISTGRLPILVHFVVDMTISDIRRFLLH
jgi:TonB family protein